MVVEQHLPPNWGSFCVEVAIGSTGHNASRRGPPLSRKRHRWSDLGWILAPSPTKSRQDKLRIWSSLRTPITEPDDIKRCAPTAAVTTAAIPAIRFPW